MISSPSTRRPGPVYPHGLTGEAIPLSCRIVGLVDVFDALRPYKKAWSRKAALEHTVAERGRHFDPALVDCFVGNFHFFSM